MFTKVSLFRIFDALLMIVMLMTLVSPVYAESGPLNMDAESAAFSQSNGETELFQQAQDINPTDTPIPVTTPTLEPPVSTETPTPGEISAPTETVIPSEMPVQNESVIQAISTSTTHCGVISSSQIWSSGSNVHVISCDVTVAPGVILTIAEGAIVKFELGTSLLVQGTLRVLGTSINPIYMTSIRDDSVGGDTNGDGATTSPASGNWSRIEFQDNSDDVNSLIDNTVIRYGGSNTTGGITLKCASPTIQSSTLTNNQYYAIRADLCSFPTLLLNTYTNNGVNGLALQGGTINSNAIWNVTDTSYFIIDNVTVGAGVTLTVNPGVVVKFENDRSLLVQGALRALGTSGAKVYFTSRHDDTVKGDTNNNGAGSSPTAGNWDSIEFQDSSIDATSLLDNTVIRYGGGCCSYGGINLLSASPTIQNSTISNNQYYGISASDSSPVIQNSTINNNSYGLYLNNSIPTIQDSTIANNSYGIYTSNSTPNLVCNNIFSNSSYGLFNATLESAINAQNQWWGGASGPYHPATNLNGLGNRVSDAVEFVPWRIQPCGPPLPPPDFKKTEPVNSVIKQSASPTLKWEANIDAASYEYCYDTSNNDACDASWTSTNTTSATLSGLSYDTIYYWQVRAINPGGTTTANMGAWWSFKVVISPPTLLTPVNEAYITTLRPVFDWNDVAGATGYTIQLSKSNTFSTISHTGNPTTSTYTPSVDLPKGKVYWRVQTKGVNGPSPWSEVRWYQSPYPPPAPTLKLPANGSLTKDYTPLFQWSAITISAGAPPFDKYQLQVATDAGFASVVLDTFISGAANNQFTPLTDFASNTKYFWRVRGVDTLPENGTWSAVWSFRAALTPPVLVSPANTSDVQTLRPAFDWSDVTGPGAVTGYTIQISKNNTFTQIVHTGNPVLSKYTPTVDSPRNLILYWRVQTKGSNGPSLWSETYSFTSANSPGTPVLSSPASNALNTTYVPLFKWSAVTLPVYTSFKQYQLQVDDNADFSSPVIDDVSITDRLVTKFQVAAPLAHNTKFYWRVRAFNTDDEVGNWSSILTIRTIADAPALLSPQSGFNAQTLRPVFDWIDVAGPGTITGYTIQISKNSTFTSIAHTGKTAKSTYIPTADLPRNLTLYWRVRTNGANGPSAWSGYRSLNSANSPSVPTLSLPALNALNTNYTPLFKWSAVIIYAPATFQYYQLQVDDNSDFSSPTINNTTITDRLVTQFQVVTPLAHNTKFYWRVLAFNNLGQYSTSAVRTFRTIIDAPILQTPGNGTPAGTLKPVFAWDAPLGPITSYTIQVATSASFGTLLVNSTTVDSTYARLTNFPAGRTLYWRVRANGANGPSAWSTTFSFITP